VFPFILLIKSRCFQTAYLYLLLHGQFSLYFDQRSSDADVPWNISVTVVVVGIFECEDAIQSTADATNLFDIMLK
jgi:hypothetical protein